MFRTGDVTSQRNFLKSALIVEITLLETVGLIKVLLRVFLLVLSVGISLVIKLVRLVQICYCVDARQRLSTVFEPLAYLEICLKLFYVACN